MTTTAAGSDVSDRASSNRELKGIARSGGVIIGGGLTGTLATFALVVLVSRASGITSAGLFFQAIGLQTTVAAAVAWGSASGLVRTVSHQLGLGNRRLGPTLTAAFVPVSVLSVVVAAAGTIASPWIAPLLTVDANQATLTAILYATLPALPFMAVTRMCVSAARGAGSSRPTVLYDVGGQALFRLAMCVVAAVFGAPVWVYGVAWTVSAAVCCVLSISSMLACVHRAGAAVGPAPRWDPVQAKAFWAFTAPRGLQEMFQVTNAWLLIVIVGALASAREAAIYTALSRSAVASALVLQGVIFAMGPRLSRAFARGEMARARTLYQTVTTWLVALSFPVALVLVCFPRGVLTIISPQAGSGAAALIVLASAMLFNLITGPVGSVLMMAGKSTWNLFDAFAGVSTMLVVAFLLVPDHGALGAAVAWGAAIIVQNSLAVFQIWRGFRMLPFTVRSVVVAAAALVVPGVPAIAVRLLIGDTIPALVVGALAMAVVYGAFLGATRRRVFAVPPEAAT